MKQNDPINFITDLQVQAPLEKFEVSLTRSGEPVDIIEEGKEQSFLADKSVVSFVSEVKEQNRKDVLNSTLLAQMAANKKFPDQENIIEWYGAFIDTLSKIGWNIQSAEMSTFEDTKSVFEIEEAIVDILAGAFGGGYVAAITKTLESIKKMSNEDHKIIAFEKNTHTFSKGCFQIALATEANDAVTLQLGTFLLTTSKKIKQILFFTSKKDKTTLQYSSRIGTLNAEVYSTVRDAIVKKLGENINTYIAEIEI
jgi:hypothetical protein